MRLYCKGMYEQRDQGKGNVILCVGFLFLHDQTFLQLFCKSFRLDTIGL